MIDPIHLHQGIRVSETNGELSRDFKDDEINQKWNEKTVSDIGICSKWLYSKSGMNFSDLRAGIAVIMVTVGLGING
jgi:hypothetical protein